jgi:cobalt-zinc-cadmium efflux system outer membrane protein
MGKLRRTPIRGVWLSGAAVLVLAGGLGVCLEESVLGEERLGQAGSEPQQAVVTTGLMMLDPSSPEPRFAQQLPFGSPLAATALPGLTLDQAINQCLMNDSTIHAGLEAVRQSHADAVTASLPPNPDVSVGATLLPLSRPFTPDAPGGPSEFDVGASYSLDWFLFGKRAAAMASATMGICVSEADYADLVRQRVTETALAFYDVLEAKSLLEVAAMDVDNLERVEGVTRKAVESGGRPQVELNRIRLELLIARRGKRDSQATLVGGQAKLRAILGMDAASPLNVAGTLDGPLTVQPLEVDEAFTVAQQNRPDIRSLRRKIARAEADMVVEYRNAYPEVKSELGLGHQFQQPVGTTDVTTWGTGIEVSVPLFNRNQGNRAKAASVVRQSNHELRAGTLGLRAEIEQAVTELQTAQQNAASVAQEELRLAAQVRDSINKAYEAGGRPLIEVLDAQRNYRETYRTYVTTRADYWRALSKYQSAIGQQVTP